MAPKMAQQNILGHKKWWG